MKCLLIGNYGVQNLGDEALKDYFLAAFPDIQWTVVSASPSIGEVSRLPGGFRSFFRFHWLQTLRAYTKTDAVVFGGGSLWTDVESSYACILWSIHALVAFFFRKPVFLAFQGIGPFRTRVGSILTRWVVRHAQFVSVRDEASYVRVHAWGRGDVLQTFDPVFSVMSSYKRQPSTQRICVVIPRHNSSTSMVQTLEVSSEINEAKEIHILSMQPDDAQEQHTIEAIRTSLTMPSALIPIRTLHDLMQEISKSSHVITQRFHGALAALAAGVSQTIIPQSDGDKLSELLRSITGNPESAPTMRMLVQKGEEALRRALSRHN